MFFTLVWSLSQLCSMFYTTLTNFRTKYRVMCKVSTDLGGIKYHVCPPVREIIHSLKLVDYLHVQADNPWYNFYFCSVLCWLCLCVRLFICALWSPAGKGLTSWLSFVVSTMSLSLSHWYPGSGVVLDCIDS